MCSELRASLFRSVDGLQCVLLTGFKVPLSYWVTTVPAILLCTAHHHIKANQVVTSDLNSDRMATLEMT